MKWTALLVGALVAALSFPLSADIAGDLETVGDAGYPGAFLYNLTSAKALSVGNAWTVLGKDPAAVFFNPSTLIGMKGSAAMLALDVAPQKRIQGLAVFALYQDGDSDQLTAEPSSGSSSVWALSGAWSSMRDINRYTDNSGTAGAALDNASILGQLTFASAFTRNSGEGGWGVSLRGISENADGTKGMGLAVSAGADFNVVLGILRCGFSFNNLGFVHYEGRETSWIKPLFSAAFLLRLPGLPTPLVLQADKVLGTDQKVILRLATEFRLFSLQGDDAASRAIADASALQLPAEEMPTELFLRFGLVEGNIYGGVSLRWKSFDLAYGGGMDPLDGRIRHSLSVEFYF